MPAAVRPNKAFQLPGYERWLAQWALPRSLRLERRSQLNAGVRRTLARGSKSARSRGGE